MKFFSEISLNSFNLRWFVTENHVLPYSDPGMKVVQISSYFFYGSIQMKPLFWQKKKKKKKKKKKIANKFPVFLDINTSILLI